MMNVLPNVYICPFRKKSASFLPEGSVKCTLLAASIASSQRMLTEIKESGTIAKMWISVESDTVRHLKSLRIISSETPTLLLTLS